MYQNIEKEKYAGTCEFRGSTKLRKVKQRNGSECNDMFVEELHNSVWPVTNVDKFNQLLDASNITYLEVKHGRRQETLLHRYHLLKLSFSNVFN